MSEATIPQGGAKPVLTYRNLTAEEPLHGTAAIDGGWLNALEIRDLMLVHALWYAENGYRVLPLRTETNLAHSRLLGWDWHYSATFPGTRDLAQIIAWWRADPAANIGIQADGCICLDIDHKPGKVNGNESLFDVMSEYDETLPNVKGAVEDTPSGGAHMWFRLPDENGEPGRLNKRDGWLPGVDIGGFNSLVAVAPSHRERRGYDLKDGNWVAYVPYRWRAHPLSLTELPLAPEWLLRDITTRPIGRGRDGERTGTSSGETKSGIPPTTYFLEYGFGTWDGSTGRNKDCYLVACRLWQITNMDTDRVMSTLYAIWLKTPGHERSKSDDGFPWSEACGAAKSAYYYIRDRRAAEESRRQNGDAR